MTFTHGFDMTVPAGSTLLVPVFRVHRSIAVGLCVEVFFCFWLILADCATATRP